MTAPMTPAADAQAKHGIDALFDTITKGIASKAHIFALVGLYVYLVILPITTLYTPSANAMLIGGNHTNVASAIGGCIAAGGTITVLKRQKSHHAAVLELMHAHHLEQMAAATGQPHQDAGHE